jgi:hypothetical protein
VPLVNGLLPLITTILNAYPCYQMVDTIKQDVIEGKGVLKREHAEFINLFFRDTVSFQHPDFYKENQYPVHWYTTATGRRPPATPKTTDHDVKEWGELFKLTEESVELKFGGKQCSVPAHIANCHSAPSVLTLFLSTGIVHVETSEYPKRSRTALLHPIGPSFNQRPLHLERLYRTSAGDYFSTAPAILERVERRSDYSAWQEAGTTYSVFPYTTEEVSREFKEEDIQLTLLKNIINEHGVYECYDQKTIACRVTSDDAMQLLHLFEVSKIVACNML